MNNYSTKDTIKRMILMLALIIFMLALVGCTTAVPVTAKFPDAPGKGAMEACPQLQKLNDGAKLSDVATTVTINYGTYYGCAVKSDTWIEWYNVQKQIFENAGK